jgi:hypothetical protein
MSGIRILVIFLSCSLFSNAQNYTYLNSEGKKIPNKENAFTRFEITHGNDSVFSVYKSERTDKKWGKKKLQYSVLKKSEKLFYIYDDEQLKDEYKILEVIENLPLGYRIKQTDNENKANLSGDAIQLFPTIMHGKCTYFDIYGMPMVEKAFNNGLRISEILLFHPVDSNLTITKIPEFPGGSRDFYIEIAKKIKYPGSFQEKIINDDVYIKFLIDVDGKMREICAGSNSAKRLTEEGVRVISSINGLWEPAHSNNNKIPVWHYAKITFGGSFIYR